MKYLLIACQALQPVALCLVFLFHPKVKKLIKNLIKPSNGSEASLAPSGASRSTISKEKALMPINSWNDFVIRARSSICDENIYTIEPQRSISSSPDPTTTKSRLSMLGHSTHNLDTPDQKRRHTIRDVMWRAKNNVPKTAPVTKCVTPPLPKNIPNQILDDVQLFDFYYNNLNSVFISENPPNEHSNHETVKTVKRIGGILSFGEKPMNTKKHEKISPLDEQNISVLQRL